MPDVEDIERMADALCLAGRGFSWNDLALVAWHVAVGCGSQEAVDLAADGPAAVPADPPSRSRADAYLRAVATLVRHGVDCPPGSPLAVDLRDAIGRVPPGDDTTPSDEACPAGHGAQCCGVPAACRQALAGGGGEPVGNDPREDA